MTEDVLKEGYALLDKINKWRHFKDGIKNHFPQIAYDTDYKIMYGKMLKVIDDDINQLTKKLDSL